MPSQHKDEVLTAYEPLNMTKSDETTSRPRRSVLGFLAANRLIPTAFATGIIGAIVCFYFVHWLSRQIFECPPWAEWCFVDDRVRTIRASINTVQGLVSAVHGISISLIAYAMYQLAETAIWPLLTRRTFKLTNMDDYLLTTRGSIPSAPFALLHARKSSHFAILLVLITVTGLLKIDTFLVGLAFNTDLVPTTFYSNRSVGGGVGMQYWGGSPRSIPGAATTAGFYYSAWANGFQDEPMVPYRNFIIDRNAIQEIGNFSANAIEIHRELNCSAWPIDISGEVFQYNGDHQWSVETTKFGNVSLREQPTLTMWTDDFWQNNDTSATTRLVFAQINGSIEDGHSFVPPPGSDMSKDHYNLISTIACDVSIDLIDSVICTYLDQSRCSTPPNVTLTKMDPNALKYPPAGAWWISVWLGAITSTLGVSVSGAQPMFGASYAMTLPVPYTSTVDRNNPGDAARDWTRRNITDFIEMGNAAMSAALTQHWANERQVLESSLLQLRMETRRSFILLLPVGLAVASVVLMLILTETLHRSCKVDVMRLGTTAEIISSTQNCEMEDVVEQARKCDDTERVLSKTKVRYGALAEGGIGLGRKANVTALRRRER